MEYPTFKLKGVVKAQQETFEDFEGPLTLILQLLSKNKIEIQDIQISLILDQYLSYLDEMASMDLEIASEFVAMASHLVYIKTRMMLDTKEEITELDELISSLETLKARNTYSQIKETAPLFTEMYKRGAGFITKGPEYLPSFHEYRYRHEPEDILKAALAVLMKEDGSAPVQVPRIFTVPERTVYPVTEKSGEIIRRLRSGGKMRLLTLFNECRSRTELVATFLSVLELCKDGGAVLSGDEEGGYMIDISKSSKNSGGEDNGNS